MSFEQRSCYVVAKKRVENEKKISKLNRISVAAIEKKLSDLERLARAEKKTQLKTYPAEPQSINHGQMATAETNSNKNEPKTRGL